MADPLTVPRETVAGILAAHEPRIDYGYEEFRCTCGWDSDDVAEDEPYSAHILAAFDAALAERLAVAMNTAQLTCDEIRLGRDLRVPAARILAALDSTPSNPESEADR